MIARKIRGVRELIAIMRQFEMPLRVIAALFVLSIVATLFEGLGVAMLLPVFEILQAGGNVDAGSLKGAHWDVMNSIADSLGINITLSILLVTSYSLILVRQSVNYVNIWQQNRVQRGAAHRVRQRAFNGYLRAHMTTQEQARVGDIANDIATELNLALSSLFAAVQSLGRSVQLLIYLAGLFALSAPMTLLSIVVIGFAAFLARNMLADVKRSGQAITKSNRELMSFIVERLRHTRLIRLSGTEKAEAGAFATLSRNHARRAMWQTMLSARMSLLPEPIALGFAYLVLFIGATVLGLSLDRLGIFVVVLIRLLPIIRGLVADYNKVMGRWPSVIKVNHSLRSLKSAAERKGGGRPFVSVDGYITYDRISFSYADQQTPALDDVSVTVPAHRMSALVGPSGAGKSTFVDLLPRIWEPSSGEIRVDGTPIAEFTTKSLRAGIAFVPQQPQIFNISAAEHIRYGKEDATDAEVREAARLAGALEFIEALPDGFDTLLSDGGKRLSGGQRQRLDIARALVRRAPILILDEPTSALDADAEAAFRDALKTLRRETDLTIIVIAHRLSTIADADQIVVLNHGRVEACGSHAELVAGDNWYARAFAKQFGAHAARAAVGALSDATR